MVPLLEGAAGDGSGKAIAKLRIGITRSTGLKLRSCPSGCEP
jgi:hypothetical protein